MKPSGIQFTCASGRLMAAALIATLAFAPGLALAANHGTRQDRVELRIKDMHTKLKITPAEEELWANVTQVMRDNAKIMDDLTQARARNAKTMNAVDDLKSYGEIAEAHAEGIKKLTPAFASLYDRMSDAQKKEADTLFRHGDRRHGHKMSHGGSQ